MHWNRCHHDGHVVIVIE